MNLQNGLSLAYIGDAVYELEIRKRLLDKGLTKVGDLHKQAIRFTSAGGQSKAMDLLEPTLSEEEMSVFRRGRNTEGGRKPKNSDLGTYHRATGFEALIGYLYLEKKEDRLTELINACFAGVSENPE